ncbi:hypothetical protein [Thermoflexibacter ruber]|uniref:Uncharacterized protein n=1 Tax=Thermoflexibacter ruber TaxID=1003 RepID=A0A1I2H908_9BACT|nr:hypothetical protein [Thermoflexibacter ruber]SFF25853.1 hypothetical protein SAMN04488541_102243 [Thermoflexibacter ruber]
MKKKVLILFLLSLFVWLCNASSPEIYAQETLPPSYPPSIPSCYELSACAVINPKGQSWCATEGTGCPCYGTPCDCS